MPRPRRAALHLAPGHRQRGTWGAGGVRSRDGGASGTRDSLLTSLIARGPALGEGAGPFTRILGLADDPTQSAADTQGLLQRLVQGALGYLLCRPDGQRRMAGDALSELTGGGQ